nr:MAG TPA: hypothetical protein [Inoviridae sp.]
MLSKSFLTFHKLFYFINCFIFWIATIYSFPKLFSTFHMDGCDGTLIICSYKG